MPTIVDILTFISITNTSETLKQEMSLFFSILVFVRSRNFMLSLVDHEKSFIFLGPRLLLSQCCAFYRTFGFLMGTAKTNQTADYFVGSVMHGLIWISSCFFLLKLAQYC